MTFSRRFLLGFAVAIGAVALIGGWIWSRRSPPATDGRSRGAAQPAAVAPVAEHVAARPGPGERVSVERIRGLLESLEPVLPGEVENGPAIELLRWWAEREPAVAIAYAASRPALHGRAGFAAELFGAWLKTDRSAAMQWAAGLPAGELRAQLLPGMIEVIAAREPGEALRLAGELSGENRRAALAALFTAWTALDPKAALRAAQALRDAPEQALALRTVMGSWFDRDANAAIGWAKNLPPDTPPDSLDVNPSVLGILIEKWAAQSPAEAGAYLLAAPGVVGRMQLLRAVAAQWADANPQQAAAWAAQIPNDTDRSLMVRGVLAAVAEKDVMSAAELALTLDPRARENGLRLVLEQWIARDAAGLSAWARALAENRGAPETLATVVTTWAAADLGSLREWVTRLPEGEARDASCAALARHFAPRQPRLAAEWAQRVANPGLRQQLIDALPAPK